jgi:tripartite-type tricarboxylate transporter receptor subunit TctC
MRAFLLWALLVGAVQVQAQSTDYPNKPIRMVVGFPPGGGTDVVARSAARVPGLADVPTAAEAGLAAYQVTTWYGVFAPAGTPPARTSA